MAFVHIPFTRSLPARDARNASSPGLRGLSEALRAEVSDLPQVQVCDVAPTLVDSPGLSHGANYTGRNVQPHIPLLDPRRVADAVVALAQAEGPKKAVTWLGAGVLPGRLAHALAPQRVGAAMRWVTERALRSARAVPTTSDGNLFVPSRGTGIDGEPRRAHHRSVARVAALGALGLALGLWAARHRST